MNDYNVLIGMYDPLVIAGNVRVMYQFVDQLAYQRYTVVIKSGDQRPESSQFFRLEDLDQYHPNYHLVPDMFRFLPHRKYFWHLFKHMTELDFDVFLTGDIRFSYLGNIIDKPTLYYCHWPTRPVPPDAKILANSKFTRDAIKRRWNVEAEVLNPCIYEGRYNASRSFDRRKIDIIAIGQLFGWKKFSMLEYLSDDYDIHLIGGEGKGPLPSNVTVHKNVTVSKLSDMLASAKVMVHPTPGEHFGIGVLEAIASGVPVVAHAQGGVWTDICTEGKQGESFMDPRNLNEKVETILDDWDEYHRWAKDRSQNFTKGKFSERIDNIMKEVLDE